jgi:hypothetical protein
MADFEKIKVKYRNAYLILTDSYGNTLEHILELFDEAKKDFPALTFSQVSIVILGGRTYNGIYAIYFNAGKGAKKPRSYRVITQSCYDTHYPKR